MDAEDHQLISDRLTIKNNQREGLVKSHHDCPYNNLIHVHVHVYYICMCNNHTHVHVCTFVPSSLDEIFCSASLSSSGTMAIRDLVAEG